MKSKTCIFFGRSGSGKGTQAALLVEKLKKLDSERETIYIETGQRFREFMNTDSYIAARVKDVLKNGELLPAFLPIWLWAGIFVDYMKNDEHIVLDGLSRRGEEAPILHSAIEFLKRERPVVVFLEVSEDEAVKRLLKRARYDDDEKRIRERFTWFETDVMKAVRYFENHPYYHFAKINGEQSEEKVHQDILKALEIEG